MLNMKSQESLNLICLASLYDVAMSIGARIRQIRQSNHLSGEKFGELVGVTKGMVSQWESDDVTIPIDRVLELRKHLDFSFDWLLNGTISYATTDPKIVAVCRAMENRKDYVKDAAVQAVLSACELADRAAANGSNSSV